METTVTDIFNTTIVEKSKLSEIDFSNIKFGSVFTDHMLECDFVDGCWQQPAIRPYQALQLDPSAKVFHYGQAIFEGMKAYKDDNGQISLFRPYENFERFNKSAVRLAMPEIPEHLFIEGLKQLINLDKNWVKKGNGNALYLRPFMIATGTEVLASPSQEYKFMIILSPAKSYFAGEVKVIIAEHYSRAANGGIGAAKAAGNYSAQFYPQKLAQEQGFQQVVWTDDTTHTKIEEAGTMNVFFRINNSLITAPVSERILDGITRKSLIQLAIDLGITVEERPITVEEVLKASENGTLQEMFGAGTAAVVSPIIGFSYQGKYHTLPNTSDTYSTLLKEKLTNIQYGIDPDPYHWMLKI